MKQAILGFCVENFREDLKKMGLLSSTVTLSWKKGFEEFLATRKKVASPMTLAYSKST